LFPFELPVQTAAAAAPDCIDEPWRTIRDPSEVIGELLASNARADAADVCSVHTAPPWVKHESL
jgi:hypothetical protein